MDTPEMDTQKHLLADTNLNTRNQTNCRKGSNKMIRNIIFDIGNVLIGFEWEKYILSLFDRETAYKVSKAMFFGGNWIELDRAVMPVDEILELFCQDEPEYRNEIQKAFENVGQCVTRCDWVIPVVRRLKERGYNVYYLSNMSHHILDSNKEAFDFVEHMDGGVFSCDVKLVKPDEAIYHTLTDRYGLRPEECIFIDDSKENIETAEKLGIKGIMFKNREQAAAELREILGV